MNNSSVQTKIDECLTDLGRLDTQIHQANALSPLAMYLTRYAIILIVGTLEVCYKRLIADYFEGLSPLLQRYITIHLRNASMNPNYNNICKALDQFSEEKNRCFKNSMNTLPNYDTLTSSLDSLNRARNEVAHGESTTMSFNEMKGHFNNTIVILNVLDNILV